MHCQQLRVKFKTKATGKKKPKRLAKQKPGFNTVDRDVAVVAAETHKRGSRTEVKTSARLRFVNSNCDCILSSSSNLYLLSSIFFQLCEAF